MQNCPEEHILRHSAGELARISGCVEGPSVKLETGYGLLALFCCPPPQATLRLCSVIAESMEDVNESFT